MQYQAWNGEGGLWRCWNSQRGHLSNCQYMLQSSSAVRSSANWGLIQWESRCRENPKKYPKTSDHFWSSRIMFNFTPCRGNPIVPHLASKSGNPKSHHHIIIISLEKCHDFLFIQKNSLWLWLTVRHGKIHHAIKNGVYHLFRFGPSKNHGYVTNNQVGYIAWSSHSSPWLIHC